jgi:hypothetical protein
MYARRAIIQDGIGASATNWFDADFTNLTESELAAKQFVDDSSTGHLVLLAGDDWVYERTPAPITGAFRVVAIAARLDGEGSGVEYIVDLNRLEYERSAKVAATLARLIAKGEDLTGLGADAGVGAGTIGGTSIPVTGSLVTGGGEGAIAGHTHSIPGDIDDPTVGGDLGGALPNPTVTGIRGRPVTPTVVDQDMLWYDSALGLWVPVGGSKVAGNLLTIVDTGGGDLAPQFLAPGADTHPDSIEYALHVRPETAHGDDDEFDDEDASGITKVEPTGTLTLTELRHALSIKYTGQSTSSDMGAALFSLTPSSPPVTIDVALSTFSMKSVHGIYGICFSNGTATTSSFVSACYNDAASDNSAEFRAGTFTNVSTNVGMPTNLTPDPVHHPIMRYLRFIWVSSNTWTFKASGDGISYVTLDASRSHSLGTPTHFGIVCSTWGGTTHTNIVTAEYIRVTESAL